jgi:hypothetical protein
MDKQSSNGHFQVHWIQWIHWTLSFGYLNGLVSTWCPYACHYVIQIHVNWPTEKANVRWKFHLPIGSNGQTKFQWTFPGPINGSIGHFRLAISMANYLHDVHMLVITSFKSMVIDQMKKQMSDGNSTGPLDPMDTPKSNGQLETHLTNGMSNGLFIFPSDILHRYWTLIREGGRANCPRSPGYVSRTNITQAEVFWIKITSQSDYKNSDFSAGENSPGGNNHNICRATKEITVSPKFGDRQILCARFFLQLRMSFV